ncbi:PsbP-related protein [Streptomyces sp. CMB-StM0423]|uniref:PsbP-related protein n=1 Tax=Streptomyces sp. CMB-StM0423 TaxID=2059884 RepID=UPI001F1AE158|nr:PsbP-related protein [Streptomyces sp. CMB-StM0423]
MHGQEQEQAYGYGQDAAYDPYAGGYTPYPGYELGIEPGRPRRRGGVIAAVVGLVVIVASGLIAGGWLLLGGDDDGEQAAEPQRSAAADPKSPKEDPAPSSEPPSPSSSPSESVVPPGYALARENEYSLAVPEDWERRVDGVSVFYEEPFAGGAFIQVYEVTEQVSPYEAVQIIEGTKENAEGYRLNELADLGHAAEYDYSYIDEELGPRRVLLHDLEAEDGKMYALLTSGPETAWPQQREVVDEMTASFCTGADCGVAGGA